MARVVGRQRPRHQEPQDVVSDPAVDEWSDLDRPPPSQRQPPDDVSLAVVSDAWHWDFLAGSREEWPFADRVRVRPPSEPDDPSNSDPEQADGENMEEAEWLELLLNPNSPGTPPRSSSSAVLAENNSHIGEATTGPTTTGCDSTAERQDGGGGGGGGGGTAVYAADFEPEERCEYIAQ